MKTTAYLLIIIPLLWIGFRMISNPGPKPGVISESYYEITYDFTLKGEKESYRVSSFLPKDNMRQNIILDSTQLDKDSIQLENIEGNQLITWKGTRNKDTTLTFNFSFKGDSIRYQFSEDISMNDTNGGISAKYLQPTEVIQPNHPEIRALSGDLISTDSLSAAETARALYNYVHEMPSSKTSHLTDAVTCMRENQCSCNGKSRLLVALFRANDIPARMVGGLILEETSKKTSHAWVEAYIGNQWVPFDALNGYFAELPAHFLEIYTGDEFLITRNTGYDFDYIYHISKKRANDYSEFSLLNIWKMIDTNALQHKPLMLLLLLPLGAFLVSVFKNVVGINTYGVFLPVLIAFAFMEMGILQGIVFFSTIIAFIGLIGFPLEKWGILHTPKISVMLTAVALYSLISIQIFFTTGWVDPAAALMFPIIILTIIAEKFARKVEEESLKDALLIYLQTLVVTLVCYWILSANTIQHFFITFPEALLIIAGCSLLLGKWIGLRVMEYARFNKIDKEANYVK